MKRDVNGAGSRFDVPGQPESPKQEVTDKCTRSALAGVAAIVSG